MSNLESYVAGNEQTDEESTPDDALPELSPAQHGEDTELVLVFATMSWNKKIIINKWLDCNNKKENVKKVKIVLSSFEF